MTINDISYIDRYFDLIIQDEDVFNKIKAKYPELTIDLISAKDNPNCVCKNRVINYLNVKLNIKEDESFIKKIIDDPKNLNRKETIDQNWRFIIEEENKKTENLSAEFSTPGKIYTVEKTDEAWSNFVNTIRASLMFQGFSVVDKETHLEVYFI